MKKNNKSKPLVIIQCYEDRQQTLPLRMADHKLPEFTTNSHSQPNRELNHKPPPPPPMPNAINHLNGDYKRIDEEKPTPKSNGTDIITNSNHRKNGSIIRTPTPDYNTKTNPPIPFKLKSIKDERVELDSLESFKLKNPSNVQPKPPANYFVAPSNGTMTKKHVRPVSVTIGEYNGGGGNKREPSKLDFLNGDKVDGPHGPADVPITNRLQSELVMTLSRSNLRKKTEAMDLALVKMTMRKGGNGHEDSDSSLDKNFHARYGNNLLPLPPSVTIPKVSKLKH